MRSTPSDVEAQIIRLGLDGDTYREIACKTGVGLATVHTCIERARKKIPEFDELRELNIRLKKSGLSFFDLTRACTVLEKMINCGISLAELEDYIKLAETYLCDKALRDDFMAYAMKLMRLEQTYGRPYQEVTKDYERKLHETARLADRNLRLGKRIIERQATLKTTEEHLSEVIGKIEKALATWKGLVKIGPERLALMVRFIQDFEALGFDANQAQDLSVWRQGLRKSNIDPDKLDRFITEKGPLDAQKLSLQLENERLGRINEAETTINKNVLAKNSAVMTVDRILTTGTANLTCKSCGIQLLVKLETRDYYEKLIRNFQPLDVWCPRCGMYQWYSPQEIPTLLGWILLSMKTSTERVTLPLDPH